MSYTSLTYHIVLATRRRRLITADVRGRLRRYLAGMIKKLGGHPIAINGPEDHMHLVASFRPDVAVSACLRDLKANSTGWVHRTFPGLKDFRWQEGYAAFTVSRSVVGKVVAYVNAQQEHHRTRTFEEELKNLLDRHGIEYDPRYV